MGLCKILAYELPCFLNRLINIFCVTISTDAIRPFLGHRCPTDHGFHVALDSGIDTTFSPVSAEKGKARYKLVTPEYRLDTTVLVEGASEETFDSVVVFHPEGSDFVCVEPLSDRNALEPSKKHISGEITLHPILPQ